MAVAATFRLPVFADLGIDDVNLLGIAKGQERNAGREHLYRIGRAPIMLEPRIRCSVSCSAFGMKRTDLPLVAIGPVGRGDTSHLMKLPASGQNKKALLLHFAPRRALRARDNGLGCRRYCGAVARKFMATFMRISNIVTMMGIRMAPGCLVRTGQLG